MPRSLVQLTRSDRHALISAVVGAVMGGAVLWPTMGAVAAVTFVVCFWLSFFRIDLGWGDGIPASFPAAIAALEILPAAQFIVTIFLILAANALVSNHMAARTWRWRSESVVWLSALLPSLALMQLERNELWNQLPDNPVRNSIVFLALPATLALGLYHFTADRFRTEPASWRSRLAADSALWSFALTIAAGFYQAGTQLYIGLSIVPLVLWYAFRRYEKAMPIQREAVMALALMPEISGHAPNGHGERCRVYADAICRALKMTPEARERVVMVAQLFQLGLFAFEEDDENIIANPLRSDLAVATTSVLSEARFLRNKVRFTEDLIRGDNRDLEKAIIMVVDTFDIWIDTNIEFASLALQRLRERFPSGYEPGVIDVFEGLLKRDPELLQRAQQAAEPVIRVAVQARREAEEAND